MKSASRRLDSPRRAVLVRRRSVGITEFSRSGCRLEASEPFAIGEIGMLTVDIQGERRVEMFRVARIAPVARDSELFEAGVEFLPVPSDGSSLQDVVVQFDTTTTIP